MKDNFKDNRKGFDNRNLDDYLADNSKMFDDLDFGSEKDRKPISKVKTHTAKFLKSASKSTMSRVKDELERSTPNTKGFVDETSNLVSDLRYLGSDFIRDISPNIQQLKRTSKLLNNKYKNFIPKSLSKKISNFNVDSDYVKNLDAERSEDIQASLNEIFSKQQDKAYEDKIEDKSEKLLDRSLERKYHLESSELLNKIRISTEYNSKVTRAIGIPFLKKSLELQYKHLYVAQDTLDTLKALTKLSEAKLDQIRHNTGLPDIQKQKLSESYKESLRQYTGQRLNESLNSWASKITKNVQTKVLDKAKMGMSSLAMAAGSYDMMQGMEFGDDSGLDIGTIAGMLAGGKMLPESVIEKISKVLGPNLRYFDKGGANLKYSLASKFIDAKELNKLEKEKRDQLRRDKLLEKYKPGYVAPKKQSFFKRTKNLFSKDGISGLGRSLLDSDAAFSARDFLFDILDPGINRNMGSLKDTSLANPFEPKSFDAGTRTSIVEIIPGYLAKILKQVTDLNTGTDNQEQVFDYRTKNFVSSKTFIKSSTKYALNKTEEFDKKLGSALGTLRGAYNVSTGDTQSFDKMLPQISRMFTNLATKRYTFNKARVQQILKYLNSPNDLATIEKQFIDNATRGISDKDKVPTLRAFLSMVTYPDMSLNNEAIAEISSSLLDVGSEDTYMERLPSFLEGVGQSRYLQDIYRFNDKTDSFDYNEDYLQGNLSNLYASKESLENIQSRSRYYTQDVKMLREGIRDSKLPKKVKDLLYGKLKKNGQLSPDDIKLIEDGEIDIPTMGDIIENANIPVNSVATFSKPSASGSLNTSSSSLRSVSVDDRVIDLLGKILSTEILIADKLSTSVNLTAGLSGIEVKDNPSTKEIISKYANLSTLGRIGARVGDAYSVGIKGAFNLSKVVGKQSFKFSTGVLGGLFNKGKPNGLLNKAGRFAGRATRASANLGLDATMGLTKGTLSTIGGISHFLTNPAYMDAEGNKVRATRKLDKSVIFDIYRKDQIQLGNPLISKQDMIDGLVYSNGKEVTNLNLIDRPILNAKTMQTLITEEDINIGLVDVNNKPVSKNAFVKGSSRLGTLGSLGINSAIQAFKTGKFAAGIGYDVTKFGVKTGVGTLGALAKTLPSLKSVAGLGMDVGIPTLKHGASAIGGALGTARDLTGKLLGFDVPQRVKESRPSLVEDILSRRDARINDHENPLDADEDGKRDSFLEILRKKKEEYKKEQESKNQDKMVRSLDTLVKEAKLNNKYNKEQVKKLDGIEGGGGIVDTILNFLGFKSLMGKGKAAGSLIKGLLGFGGRAAATAAATTAATGTAAAATTGAAATAAGAVGATAAGAGVLSTIAAGLGTIASGVAAVVTSPVVLAAAATAAITYAVYKSNNPSTDQIEQIRANAYGINLEANVPGYALFTGNTLDVMQDLEKLTLDISNGKRGSLTDEEMKKYTNAFGLDAENPGHVRYFNTWYSLRFIPIFSVFVNICGKYDVDPLKAYKLAGKGDEKMQYGEFNKPSENLTTQTPTPKASPKPMYKGAKYEGVNAPAQKQQKSQKQLDLEKHQAIVKEFLNQSKPIISKYPNLVMNVQAADRFIKEEEKKKGEEDSGVEKTKQEMDAIKDVEDSKLYTKGATDSALSTSSAAAAASMGGGSSSDTTAASGMGSSRYTTYTMENGVMVAHTPDGLSSPMGVNTPATGGNVDISGYNPKPLAPGELGALSSKYESGKKGAAAIGWDSTGGTSYGSYQLAAKKGSLLEFAKWAESQPGGKEVAEKLYAAGLGKNGFNGDTGSRTGPIVDAWQELAVAGKLDKLEHDYIKSKYFDVLMNRIKSANPELYGMISNSKILQDAIWSTAVQHGPGVSFPYSVYKSGMTEEEYAKALYDARSTKFGSSSSDVQAGVMNRFKDELSTVIATLKKEKSDGGMEASADTTAPDFGSDNNVVPDTGMANASSVMEELPMSASDMATTSNINSTNSSNAASYSNVTEQMDAAQALQVKTQELQQGYITNPSNNKETPNINIPDFNTGNLEGIVAKTSDTQVSVLTSMNSNLETLIDLMSKQVSATNKVAMNSTNDVSANSNKASAGRQPAVPKEAPISFSKNKSIR